MLIVSICGTEIYWHTCGYHKTWGISWLAEELSACQEALCSWSQLVTKGVNNKIIGHESCAGVQGVRTVPWHTHRFCLRSVQFLSLALSDLWCEIIRFEN
jgi:hypothetical protein